MFQKFYARMLARRLVQQNSASDDAEASMISKLKVQIINYTGVKYLCCYISISFKYFISF